MTEIIKLIKSDIGNDFGFDNITLEDLRFVWKEAQKDLTKELLGCDLDVDLHLRLDNKAKELLEDN